MTNRKTQLRQVYEHVDRSLTKKRVREAVSDMGLELPEEAVHWMHQAAHSRIARTVRTFTAAAAKVRIQQTLYGNAVVAWRPFPVDNAA